MSSSTDIITATNNNFDTAKGEEAEDLPKDLPSALETPKREITNTDKKNRGLVTEISLLFNVEVVVKVAFSVSVVG